MGNSEHYKIVKEDGFFIISFIGEWTEEIARTLFYELQEVVAASKYEKFGLLLDFREWEGSIDELTTMGKVVSDYFFYHGQIISVHVNNSAMKQEQIQFLQDLQSSRMTFKKFHSMEIALPWMKAKLKQLKGS